MGVTVGNPYSLDDLLALGRIMGRIMEADRSIVTVTRNGVSVNGRSPLTLDETALVARILNQ